MAIPTHLINKGTQLSNYDNLVRSTDGSPIIGGGPANTSTAEPNKGESAFPLDLARKYFVGAEADGRIHSTITVTLGSDDLVEGETFAGTGGKLGIIYKFTRTSTTTATVIYKATAVDYLIVTNSLTGDSSGVVATVASIVSNRVSYYVDKTPMVGDGDGVPVTQWNSTDTYAANAYVKHTYTPTDFGKYQNIIITGAKTYPKNIREERVYKNISGGNLTGTEPGAAPLSWSDLGQSTVFELIGGTVVVDSRLSSYGGVSSRGSSREYSHSVILDSTISATDLTNLTVSTNTVEQTLLAVDGNIGVVSVTAASSVLSTVVGEEVGVGDGATVTFYTKLNFADPITGFPSVVPADITVTVSGVGAVVPTSIDGATKEIILPSAPAEGSTITVDYTAILAPSINESLGTGDGATTDFFVQYPNIVDVTGVPTLDETEVIVKIDGITQLDDGSIYTIDDAFTGLISFVAAPLDGEILQTTYKRVANYSAGDEVVVDYFHNAIHQPAGDSDGPVIAYASYNTGTNVLTITRDTVASAVDFTDVTFDPTKVFVEYYGLTGSTDPIKEIDERFYVPAANTITIPAMQDMENYHRVRIWVVKGSKKSNSVYLSFPS
jgi:hypothetical protein